MSLLIRNGTIITQNKKREIVTGDLLVEGNRIKKIGTSAVDSTTKVIDAQNKFVIPGLIQAHTHLCQTLFRGRADDLSLFDWLKRRIWPMEHRHSEKTLSASADLGLLEMQLFGTTTILDMGTTRHTHRIFEAAKKSGVRYFGGNCFMDLKKFSGPLFMSTNESLAEVSALQKKFHKPEEGLSFVLNPRFVVCCTDEILEYCAEKQKIEGTRVHIHASENLDEIKIVRARTKKNNVDYLASLGLLNSKTIVVHGVHLTEIEIKKMAKSKTPLVHCPSANLKLASGFAPVTKYLKEKMVVALGSDGAACNNTMDPFRELRLAALLQKPLFGPRSLPAQEAFDMLTINGAKALGLESELGSLEEGKLADIVLIDRNHPSLATVENPVSALVYSCSGENVSDVISNGEIIVRNKVHQKFDAGEVIARAREAIKLLDI
ncbi:MAG: amidohydrolase family protein [Pseudomonadota bacterium]|nr:amidohydrolase family protein [Pseudomonadota bacterium]